MSDDHTDVHPVCPRCLRTEHSPSCLRRQEVEAATGISTPRIPADLPVIGSAVTADGVAYPVVGHIDVRDPYGPGSVRMARLDAERSVRVDAPAPTGAPAALLRAAIAKAAARVLPYDFTSLLTLAQALEAVGRSEYAARSPGRHPGLMHGAAMRLHSDDVTLTRVIALTDKWRSRDTQDQWAVRELVEAIRGEDPSDG